MSRERRIDEKMEEVEEKKVNLEVCSRNTHSLILISTTSLQKMLLLLLDWDETLTNKDTLSLIAPASPPTPSSSLPSSPRFSTLSKFYMEDLTSHTENEQTPTTLRDQLRHLDSIDKVELKSQERVERSGLFANYSPELLEKRVESQDLTFRTGWATKDANEQLSASQWIQNESKSGHLELHIISVGWSARFISLGLKSKKGGSFPPNIPQSIIANEIQIGKDGKGTGKMTKSNDAELERFESIDLSEEEKQAPSSSTNFSGMRTGIHKLRELKRLRNAKLETLNEKEKNE